jgi:two-component system cell cycle sensor histidine kinase/response regulator CckA
MASTGLPTTVERSASSEGELVPLVAERTVMLQQANEQLRIEIAQRDRIEEALRSSEAKYRCLIENLEQSIFLKDRDFRFVAVNPRFCQGLGLDEEEVLGKTDFDFYPTALAEKYRADDVRVLTESVRLEVEEENVAGGQTRVVRVVKTPVKDDQGQGVGVLGIFWDVTSQRALEAQLRQAQKMEAVGQLAGGVAHDFNNLLTVILGNTAMVLSRMAPADPCRELLQAVEKAGSRAASLTRQLLGFSRRATLRAEPVSLAACVQETVHLLRRTIDPRINLDVQISPDLWPVLADPTLIGQALMNLCLNARDAMPQGGRLLLRADNVDLGDDYARLHLEGRAGAFVRLRVEDTGCGIPAEVRPHIFEPFFTTKGLGVGTGLGLAMVFGIVKQHQGWINCYSEIGRGTRFDLFLPRHEHAPAPASVVPPAPPSGTETILLADDEPMIRNLGRRILEHCGYQVLLAEDGEQAIEAYVNSKGHIDLVILDMTMPRLSGRDAFRRLRQIDPEVGVLFASGYSADNAASEEVERALGFVGKPYRPDELARMVRCVLDQRKSCPPR